jgi:hypothetical protein
MLSGLQQWMNLIFHISAYDINCQYRIHFWERLTVIIKQFCQNSVSAFRSIQNFTIPTTWAGICKFHELAHKLSCCLQYSFHCLLGGGQTDGEAMERIWAAMIFLGLRTQEMSPGHRHDTINYYHNDMNWRKTYGIGMCDATLCWPTLTDTDKYNYFTGNTKSVFDTKRKVDIILRSSVPKSSQVICQTTSS